jgi:hypothetical protein
MANIFAKKEPCPSKAIFIGGERYRWIERRKSGSKIRSTEGYWLAYNISLAYGERFYLCALKKDIRGATSFYDLLTIYRVRILY